MKLEEEEEEVYLRQDRLRDEVDHMYHRGLTTASCTIT
jgi:hypothetical protein